VRFAKFLGVGAAGFVVDTVSFALLVGSSRLGPWAGRAAAFILAAATTWALNRALVFPSSGRVRQGRQALQYFAATVFSGALNLATYSTIIAIFGTDPFILQIAFVAGVGVGLISNYMLYSGVVFSR
jgi:putative flippase GtrA